MFFYVVTNLFFLELAATNQNSKPIQTWMQCVTPMCLNRNIIGQLQQSFRFLFSTSSVFLKEKSSMICFMLQY